MKKTILAIATLALSVTLNAAGDCELNIAVVPPEAGEKVPAAAGEYLASRLSNSLSSVGIAASPDDSQFFLTGRFDNAYKNYTGGVQPRDVINTTLTLYIGDADGRKIFCSKSFDLKGVGKSEEQAYKKAVGTINPQRADIKAFLMEGKAKIVEYFDKNYPSYIQKSRTAMNSRKYDEALYYALQIPECCVGFGEAQALALEIYSHQVDYIADQLFAQAKAAFGADPTANGAREAFGYISQIDPQARCYSAAVAYGDQMQKEVKSQWEFENIQKYKDELALKKQAMKTAAEVEKARIESARAVAVAWAKSRPVTRVYYRWY